MLFFLTSPGEIWSDDISYFHVNELVSFVVQYDVIPVYTAPRKQFLWYTVKEKISWNERKFRWFAKVFFNVNKSFSLDQRTFFWINKTTFNLKKFLRTKIYWIYNLIRAVLFSKFERLFKKNVYNIIIQSIAHLKIWLLPIFLAICGFHPKGTAPAWRAKMNQANFWYPVLMWTVFQSGRSASTGTNGSQKGQGLGYKAGGVKLPIHRFPNSS